MPSFTYTYRNPEGISCTQTINALDRKQALMLLKKQGVVALKLEESKAGQSEKGSKKPKLIHWIRNKKEASDFKQGEQDFSKKRTTTAKGESIGLNLLKRLYELHKSGMPIGDAVRILQNRLSDRAQKALVIGIWRDLSEGLTLAKALSRRSRYFTPSVCHVIQAGEATGHLAPVLAKVIQYLEEKQAIRKKMLSSMAYPSFVTLVALLVVVLFLTVLLPQIEGMLERLGGEMTWSAQLLIDGSNWMLKLGPFFILGLIILFIGLGQWKRTQMGKRLMDRWSLRIPLIGNIIYYSNLYQTGNLIATLLQSGINTTETLQLTEKTIENAHLKQQFSTAKGQINEGASLTQAFRLQNFMPDVALDILSVGEDIGELAQSMADVTESFKESLSQRLNAMTTIVSSLALGFAFGLVTLIAIGIVTSVFEVSKTLSI